MIERWWLRSVILLAVVLVPLRAGPAAQAKGASSPVNCAALELHLAPGLNPPSPRSTLVPAPDAPRTPFTLSLPLFPGLTPLQHPAGSPFPEHQGTPYLQTASAEFDTAMSSDAVQAWYQRAMPACGWRASGSWDGNAGAFPSGISFDRNNHNTTADVGLKVKADGSTDVAIAVGAVRYPVPPPRARIHGPFVELRIALRAHGNPVTGKSDTVRVTVTSGPAIRRLVRAIDAVKTAFTVSPLCLGGFSPTGPAWLTFVRAGGGQVHAFESGPGACGGLAVQGYRWLLDPGTVWAQILRLAKVRA